MPNTSFTYDVTMLQVAETSPYICMQIYVCMFSTLHLLLSFYTGDVARGGAKFIPLPAGVVALI